MAISRHTLWITCLCLVVILMVSSHAATLTIKARLEANYRLQKPQGDGPFPAVMLVSGCSGFSFGVYDRVEELLLAEGFVILRVDYLAARGFSSCYLNVSTEEVASDIGIASEYLRSQTFVKKGAINVLGWSYGGGGALASLSETQERKPAVVDAVIAYYPYCNDVPIWALEVPILVLFGDKDNVVSSAVCKSLISRLPNQKLVSFRVYPGAHHGFDNPNLPPEMQYSFGTLGYKADAAKASWKEIERFLRR